MSYTVKITEINPITGETIRQLDWISPSLDDARQIWQLVKDSADARTTEVEGPVIDAAGKTVAWFSNVEPEDVS